MMHQKIKEKKEELSSLIKKEDIQEINYCGQNTYKALDGSIPNSYQSNIFSKLQYEDLKTAHTETVVPVGQKDYNSILKFNNAENLKQYRNNQNTNPLSQTDANQYLNNKIKIEDDKNIQMAYKLTKQDEDNEKTNKEWWSNLMLLK